MIIAIIFISILLFGLIKRVDCFNSFREGAKTGIETCIQIIPPMVGLMVAIAVFRKSGAMDHIVSLLTPVTSLVGIPESILPMAILKPISGSASLALLNDIFKTDGPDSLAGRIASVMMGSTETVFYTVTIYLSAVGIKKTSYIIPVALACSFIGFVLACIVCNIL